MAAAKVDSNATPILALCVSLPPTMTFHICPPVSPNVIQGVPPATVAEWTLQGDGNLDFYDGAWAVSLQYSTLSWTDGTDGVAVRVLCHAALFSIPRRWVQSPDGDHPFRNQLFRRLVPRRPKSWVSSTARRPARPVREPGRVQERLRSQP